MPALKYHLLLVDDDADTLGVLDRLLKHEGYNITCAQSVASALACANERNFDLLVSDLALGDGDGMELMEQISRRTHIPAIALTGLSSEDEMSAAFAASFRAVLVKPITFTGLASAIHRLLDAQIAARLH